MKTGVYGRKIDLFFKWPIPDSKHVKSSVEIKSASVSEDVEEIRLNKNIRVNKSILHNIVAHMGELGNYCYVLGIDIIGKLDTYLRFNLAVTIIKIERFLCFCLLCYHCEDGIAALKLEEDNMLLPGDVDDLQDLVFGNTLD